MEVTGKKKAVVVGGSNRIGLAISANLIKRGYFVEILDRGSGDIGILPQDSVHHTYCDLLDLDEELFSTLAADKSVEVLMVMAGIGHVADFEYFHTVEIQEIFTSTRFLQSRFSAFSMTGLRTISPSTQVLWAV